MKTALSTACFFPEYVTEDAVRLIGELGIETAEVFLGSYSEYQEDYCKSLREALDKCNVRAFSVHVLSTQFEPQLFSVSDRQRRDSRVFFEKVLKGAQILGAQAYVFHGPPVRKQTTPNHNYRKIAQTADNLSDLSAEYGIKFTWENVYWCWYDDPLFASRVMEHSKSGNLYFTLDIKQAMKSPESDPMRFLEEMGNRVANVHLCDYDNEGRLFLPGRGTFPFHMLKDRLAAVDYDGPVIMEVYRTNYGHYTELAESLHFLQSIF